jgi:hypothetical protein
MASSDTVGTGPWHPAFQMSQPDLNDMETVYANTIDKGIPLIGFSPTAADAAKVRGRALRGQVHVSR